MFLFVSIHEDYDYEKLCLELENLSMRIMIMKNYV